MSIWARDRLERFLGRNVRVRALRAAFAEAKPEGAAVILSGLGDKKRRVKEVALKSAKPFLDQPRVAERIATLVEDDNEYGRVRAMALLALGGGLRTPYLDRASHPEVRRDAGAGQVA